ncbi:MAG: energy transducer TonB [Fusobacteriaceae bacterium]|jgi:protein TonB|nr:energy transducer TonB [Fusobacteriaceae bacterium]
MKKIDYFSLTISLIINSVLLLLIPPITSETVVDTKIKVGLVAFEDTKKAKLNTKGEGNKNTAEKSISKEIKNEVKNDKEEKAPEIKPAEESKIAKESIETISKSISAPDINVLTSDFGTRESNYVGTIGNSEEKKLTEGIITKDNEFKIDQEKIEMVNIDNIKETDEKFIADLPDKIAFNSDEGKDKEFDRIFTEEAVVGLPSGYKMGVEDGSIVATWDISNKEPVYPESAQLRGMHGIVKIRMTINEDGNVDKFQLEKGSGVPEINQAIEEVGRTWKIHLSRRGQNVQGEVVLEYSFTLRGYD